MKFLAMKGFISHENIWKWYTSSEYHLVLEHLQEDSEYFHVLPDRDYS